MSSMSYLSLKTTSMAKDAEEKRNANREKAMLIFTYQLLIEKGYLDTATCLASECSMKLEDFEICDNIDLRSVFMEFETYYQVRYQRYPQYFKKAALSGPETLLAQMKATKNAAGRKSSSLNNLNLNSKKKSQTPANGGCEKTLEMEGHGQNNFSVLEMTGQSLSSNQLMNQNLRNHNLISTNLNEACISKLLKPISSLDFPNEDARSFAEMIQRDIVIENLDTKWEDVIGLDDAKCVLEQTLHYTKEFLEFFGNGLSPWKGLLLYGPPGIGKTMLAKAVATECQTTFFNISSSSLLSKWRGDSEKIVKTLFDLARFHAPSTIFFDEFDALGSKRDGGSSDSDASRRFKSELLQQMDGLMSTNTQYPIFILAATNLPWELDPAILRRLEKRIYIPLPSSEDRTQILKLYFGKTARNVVESSQKRNVLACQLDFEKLSAATELYSGSDLQQIVKDVVIRKFRENFGHKKPIRQLLIKTDDVLATIEAVQPTISASMVEKYAKWSCKNS